MPNSLELFRFLEGIIYNYMLKRHFSYHKHKFGAKHGIYTLPDMFPNKISETQTVIELC